MSTAAEIHTGGRAPSEPAANTRFHQETIDFLIAGASAEGWQGAEFCDYDRFENAVSIGIREAAGGWPSIEDLRAWREAHKSDPPRRMPELVISNQVSDQDGQGSFAL